MGHLPRTGIAFVLLGFALAVPGRADAPDEVDKRAQTMVAALAKQDFAAAGKHFDPAMQKALPADKLEATWKGILGQTGSFQKTTGIRREKVDKYQVVVVTCQFEKTALDARITF